MPEEGGTAATVEASLPPSNSNSNENENVEEGSGENCVSIFTSILL